MQWFSHITEIPQNKRKLLKREVSCQEVFFDQVSGYDNDIAVETIIESVLVCMAAHLYLQGRKKPQQFGKCNRTVQLLYSFPNQTCDVYLYVKAIV